MAEHEPKADTPYDKYVDLVFEGGGVKGIALVGALSVLIDENGYQPQNVAGTSAGAIVATLLAAGYTPEQLRDIIAGLDFSHFMDTNWEDRIPLIGKPLSVLTQLGVYEGDYFFQLMTKLLGNKGKTTFGDLVDPRYADQPAYRYKVRVIASDITGRELLILPQDAVKLGINPDDLNIALAVRMSMSIPIFFEPVRFRNPKTGQEHIIVDGGLLSNFPVWLFDSEGVPDWPTFGIRLVEEDLKTSLAQRMPPENIATGGAGGVIDYLKDLVGTMLEAHDRLYIEKANFARTIPIPTLGVNGTDFNLSKEAAMKLFESGRAAAKQFLQTWNFEGYIAEFRQGAIPSRREEIAKEMKMAASDSSGKA